MIRKVLQPVLAVVLAIGVIGGGALLLRGSLAQARDRADGSVVIDATGATLLRRTDEAVPPEVVATRDPAAVRDIAYGTVKCNPSQDKPSAKDIPYEDAARQAIAALESLFDVSLDGAAVEANYHALYSAEINRPNWRILVIPAGDTAVLWFDMDSVTGKMYFASLNRKNDVANWQETLGGLDGWEARVKEVESDSTYESDARTYMAKHLPEETVLRVKNQRQGSMTAYYQPSRIITVAVDVEGGAGYVLWIGVGSHEVLGVNYYPEGVPSMMLSGEQRSMWSLLPA